jgi:hypothetical protein
LKIALVIAAVICLARPLQAFPESPPKAASVCRILASPRSYLGSRVRINAVGLGSLHAVLLYDHEDDKVGLSIRLRDDISGDPSVARFVSDSLGLFGAKPHRAWITGTVRSYKGKIYLEVERIREIDAQ